MDFILRQNWVQYDPMVLTGAYQGMGRILFRRSTPNQKETCNQPQSMVRTEGSPPGICMTDPSLLRGVAPPGGPPRSSPPQWGCGRAVASGRADTPGGTRKEPGGREKAQSGWGHGGGRCCFNGLNSPRTQPGKNGGKVAQDRRGLPLRQRPFPHRPLDRPPMQGALQGSP